MFIAMHDNTVLLNSDYIVHLKAVPKREFRDLPLDLYSPDEMAKMGFRVGYADVYLGTPSWDIAFDQADGNDRLVLPSDCRTDRPGYWEIGGGEYGLIDKYVKKNGTVTRDNNNMCFLPKERWNEVYAYELMMSDGSTMYMTVDEYKIFVNALDPLMVG